MSEITIPVNATRMRKPAFLTLTNKPANRVAFKAVRADNDGDDKMTTPHIQRRRVRRSDPLLQIKFEAGSTEDEVKALAEAYGFEQYTITTDDDGLLSIVRSEAPEGAETVTVKLSDTVSAVILKPISNSDVEPVQRNVAVAGVEFALDYFETEEDIKRWCADNSVDFSKCVVENGDQGTVVWRSALGEAEEVRRLKVDDGVQFVVKRAECCDIPTGFVEVVCDTAYGNWGWGQLDFAATLLDIEFSQLASSACEVLRRVTDRILFYSDVPVLFRKELINNATSQFANYIGALIDGLPTRVVVATRTSQEKPMGTNADATTNETEAQRAEAEAAAAAAAASAPVTDEPTDLKALRSDVTALSDSLAKLVARLDATDAPAPAAAPAPTPAPADAGLAGVAEAIATITRSVKELSDSTAAVVEKVAALEGTAIVRSDDSDDPQKTNDAKDPFAGVFSRSSK